MENELKNYAKNKSITPLAHPKIERGQVWCTVCGRTEKVNPAESIQNGWLKCCGLTMTIDSPEERAELKK